MSYVHTTEGHQVVGNETDGRHEHLLRLNNWLCSIWPHTPYGKAGAQIPNCANEDRVLGGDIDVRFFYYIDPESGQKSHQYWITDDGRVVCDTNELMDLKSMNHLGGIVCTIIKDIYGDFDAEEATKEWMESLGVIR